MGGGIVVDPWPPARGRRRPDRLVSIAALAAADPNKALLSLLTGDPGWVDLDSFAVARGLTPEAAAAPWRPLSFRRVEASGTLFGFDWHKWQALTSQFPESGLNLGSEVRNVTLYRRPHLFQIHREMIVHQNVPHGDDLSPWYLGVAGLQGFRDLPRRLADDLQVMQNPCLHQLVALEGVAPLPRVFLNAAHGFEDILQATNVVLHRG